MVVGRVRPVASDDVITEGPGAFGQAFVTALMGYGFYLVLRVSGVILVPILVHALWDFGLSSANIGPDAAVYGAAGITSVVTVALAVILVVRRHRIELPDESKRSVGERSRYGLAERMRA